MGVLEIELCLRFLDDFANRMTAMSKERGRSAKSHSNIAYQNENQCSRGRIRKIEIFSFMFAFSLSSRIYQPARSRK